MLTLTRLYAIVVLRSPGTWVFIAIATLFAWIGISLNLFAFDRDASRAIGETVGTMEIAAVLLATRARTSGVTPDGLRDVLRQRVGPVRLELASALGSGAGAGMACAASLALLCVLYNFMSALSVGVAGMLALGLCTEAAVASAWVGLVGRWAGRVAATSIALGAFIVARLNVPIPLRAFLPAPLSLTADDLIVRTLTALLAACGLSWLAAACPESAEEMS